MKQMDVANEPNELDELVAAIWGRGAIDAPPDPDPEMRELQNRALSLAIRLYLQSYLDDMKQNSVDVGSES